MANLHVSVPEDYINDLKLIKVRYGVPLSETVRRAISEYLEKHEIREEVKGKDKAVKAK